MLLFTGAKKTGVFGNIECDSRQTLSPISDRMRKRKAFADKELDDIMMPGDAKASIGPTHPFVMYPSVKNFVGNEKTFPGSIYSAFNVLPFSTFLKNPSNQGQVVKNNKKTQLNASLKPVSEGSPFLSRPSLPTHFQEAHDSIADNKLDNYISEENRESCEDKKDKDSKSKEESKIETNSLGGNQFMTSFPSAELDLAFRYRLQFLSNLIPTFEPTKREHTSSFAEEIDHTYPSKEHLQNSHRKLFSPSNPFHSFELYNDPIFQTLGQINDPFILSHCLGRLSSEIQYGEYLTKRLINKENIFPFCNQTNLTSHGLNLQFKLNHHLFGMQNRRFFDSVPVQSGAETDFYQSESGSLTLADKKEIKTLNVKEIFPPKRLKHDVEKRAESEHLRFFSKKISSKNMFQLNETQKQHQNDMNLNTSEVHSNYFGDFQPLDRSTSFERNQQGFDKLSDLESVRSSCKSNFFNTPLKTTKNKLTPFTVQSIIGKATA